jgi:hypothetical protein
MTFLEIVKKDVGDIEKCKTITPKQLESLGYTMTEECIHLMVSKNSVNPDLVLFKLQDMERVNRELDFCYIFCTERKKGLILPKSFKSYAKEV